MPALRSHGLWLEASPERLLRRVADRRNDASDATPDVVKDQLGRPLGAIEWPQLTADGDMEADPLRLLTRIIGANTGHPGARGIGAELTSGRRDGVPLIRVKAPTGTLPSFASAREEFGYWPT